MNITPQVTRVLDTYMKCKCMQEHGDCQGCTECDFCLPDAVRTAMERVVDFAIFG